MTVRRPHGVESGAHVNGRALRKQPRPGNGGMSSDATPTVLTPEALAFAAEVRQAQRDLVKDKAYRATPVGGEVGRFLRSLRWSERSQNTLDTYEIVLARLAHDHAHFKTLDEFTTETLRDFLDEHWGDSSPATRRNRLAIVKSFFRWATEERGLGGSPAERIKPPKQASVERQAYAPDMLETLRLAQPTLRDQICVQLWSRLALRKDELRILRVRDFDIADGTVVVRGKGSKVVVMPIGFPDLKADLEVHLVGRHPDECLLFPKKDPMQPMSLSAVHRWFKRALARAGLPATVKIHELRHSAADNLWRETGNLLLAQQLLRHSSVATTQAHLHPTRDDLSDALASLKLWRSEKGDLA